MEKHLRVNILFSFLFLRVSIPCCYFAVGLGKAFVDFRYFFYRCKFISQSLFRCTLQQSKIFLWAFLSIPFRPPFFYGSLNQLLVNLIFHTVFFFLIFPYFFSLFYLCSLNSWSATKNLRCATDCVKSPISVRRIWIKLFVKFFVPVSTSPNCLLSSLVETPVG